MGLSRIFGFCFAFLFAASVNAANVIDLGPSDWRNLGPSGAHTSSGIRSSFGQTVRMPPTSLNTLTVTRNPVVPYGSVGNALRTIGRATPGAIAASAGMAALFAAMDWVFDEGQWKKEDLMDEEDLYGFYYVAPFSDGLTFSNAHDACEASLQFMHPVWKLEGYTVSNRLVCHYYDDTSDPNRVVRTNYSSNIQGGGCSEGFVYVNNPPHTGCYKQGLVPLTNSDFSELTAQLPSLPASDVAGAAGDAQRQIGNPLPGYHDTQMTGPSSFTGPETTSTSTDPVTGDTVVTTTNTTTNISYGDTTITTTDTKTTNTYTNGSLTGTETTTETPGDLPVSSGGGAGDWPAFCEWAPSVCEWMDWTKEAPEEDLPLPELIDTDFYEEKNISFGSKSCPPDYEINLAPFMQNTVGVSFQPFCDFAALIYFLVMAASYVSAAYITIGVARNG